MWIPSVTGCGPAKILTDFILVPEQSDLPGDKNME